MTIWRTINGIKVEIVLTDGELWDAFKEEQHKCDLSDIDNYFEDLSDDDLMEILGVTMEEVEPQKETMAYLYRKYMDSYSEDWITQRDEAIYYTVRHYIKNE